AHHGDHPEQRGFRRNFEFRSESPSIQPSTELFQARASPRNVDPRAWNPHAIDQVLFDEMSNGDDPAATETIPCGVMESQVRRHRHVAGANNRHPREMEKSRPG